MAGVVKAGMWVRVSSGGQDEALQIPDIQAYCDAHGYDVGKVYKLHDKSAVKGEQQKRLNEVVADMGAGEVEVLVCWHSDRLDRRGPKAAYAFLYAAELAGGRIESVLDPEFGREDVGSEVLTTIRMAGARDEARLKAERVRIGLDATREAGGYIGNAPWGYRKTGPKRGKRLEPTADGRRWVPVIYRMIADGQSLREVCEFLNENKVGGKRWTAPSLSLMIRISTYQGLATDSTGKVTHACEGLVDSALWHKAGERLSSKAGKPRGAQPRSTLTGTAVCGRCGGTMYQHHMQRGLSAAYYRCGGCGLNVPMRKADAALAKILDVHAGRMMFTVEVFPGHDYSAEIKEAEYRLARLGLQGLDEDEEDQQRAELRAWIRRLRSLPTVPDEVREVATGETYRDEFARLSVPQRAQWLRENLFLVTLSKQEISVVMPWKETASLPL